jgi:hypothetical protein
LVLSVRDNMMEDATGKDKDKALLLLNFFTKKSRSVFSYLFFY